MTVASTIDVRHVRHLLEHAGGLGLGKPARRRRAGVPAVPDIIACTFDPENRVFHLVYADLSSESLALSELPDVGQQEVVAWEIDPFSRGVEVLLDDGTLTSFSAEFPRYLHDEDYRRRVDARRGPAGQDLGQRIAQRVRTQREERGWSVAELARRADMAAPNLHRVESGKHVPSMQTVARLAAALGVPMERLLRARAL